jgi:hypothetical protein
LRADVPAGVLEIIDPVMPSWLERLYIHGLRVGADTVNLQFERLGSRTSVRVDKTGSINVRLVPADRL